MPQAQANGITIEYESFGRASDPTVLLIMGLGAQMTMWPIAFCKGLAERGFRVIRFDNRDIGKSTHLTNLGTPNLPEAMMKMMSGQPVPRPTISRTWRRMRPRCSMCWVLGTRISSARPWAA